MPKSVPKSIQTCFRVIFSKKFYAQCSMQGRVSKIFKFFFFKIPKMPKSVPKRIQTCFRVIFFEKILCPVFHGGSSLRKFSYKSKNSQNSKMPKIVPKSIQTCFEHVLGQTFRKNFAQLSMECRVFENFQRKTFSKFQKCPKVFPKVSKRVLIVIWTILSKNFCPVFHGRSSLRKFSKKSKKFQIS